MPLRPFTNNAPNPIFDEPITAPVEEVREIPDELNNILAQAGLAKPKLPNDIDNVRAVFNAHGAGINNIAEIVANTMQNGQTDSSRLKACEIAMQVQGIIQKIDEKQTPEIKINIIGSNNRTIVNLVCPEEVNINGRN